MEGDEMSEEAVPVVEATAEEESGPEAPSSAAVATEVEEPVENDEAAAEADDADADVDDGDDDEDDGEESSESEAGTGRGRSGRRSVSVAQLEQEGDVAADYLEELLDIADLDGDIDLDVEGDRASVAVVGEEVKHLIGAEGEVLESLQELTRLAVYRETGQRSRLMLDVGGFRAQRRAELVALAETVAEKVRANGEAARLEPMTPFERKIVHDAIADAGLVSESEGEEPDRRVVVRPA